MGYLIFIPGKRNGSAESLRDVGMGGVIEGASILCSDVGLGPDGGPGLLLAIGDVLAGGERFAFARDSQRWQPVPPDPKRKLAAGRCWLGRNLDGSLSPEHLARATQYPSLPVTLADGQEWLVPVARQLPHFFGKDEAGHFTRRVKPQFAAFCGRSQAMYDAIINRDADRDVRIGDGFAYAAEALALNYAVDEDVLDFLELIDDASFPRVVGATIEAQLIREVEREKKTPE